MLFPYRDERPKEACEKTYIQGRVSVIIPTFGRADRLEMSIQSVLNQSYRDIEIVVVDDNFSDSESRKLTEALIKRVKRVADIIYVKHDRNMGGAVARNTGVEHSTGNLITFLDDDDQYCPVKVQKQVDHIKKENLDISLCGANVEGEERTFDYQIPRGTCLTEFLMDGNAWTPMIMMKKEIFKNVGGFDENSKKFQDHILMLKCHALGARVGIIKEYLYTIFMHKRERITTKNKNSDAMHYLFGWLDLYAFNLSKKDRQKYEFNKSVRLSQFFKRDNGLWWACIKSFLLLFNVRTLRQFWAWCKIFIKVFIRP